MTRTWQERCEDFDDSHITTHQDVKNKMMEEIEELRAAYLELRKAALRVVNFPANTPGYRKAVEALRKILED